MECPVFKEFKKHGFNSFPKYGIYKNITPEKLEEQKEFVNLIKNKQDFELHSFPNFFVGEYDYPNSYAGYVMTTENLLGNPRNWYGKSLAEFSFERSLSLRAKEKTHVTDYDLQLATASVKPIYLELKNNKNIYSEKQGKDLIEPSGFTGVFEKVKILSNFTVPKKIEGLIEDNLKVNEALPEIISNGFDNYYLQNLLTAGLLGQNKKLVPTKWSITATDDIITKHLIKEIKQYDTLDTILFFENEYLDNHFGIILQPGNFMYEQFEILEQTGTMTQEYEYYKGRKKYASLQGGGYYAARLPVCEYLSKIQRQAKVTLIREIGPEYTIPVGVWEVRENSRKAFEKQPIVFNNLIDLKKHLQTKFIHTDSFYKKSIFLNQRTLQFQSI